METITGFFTNLNLTHSFLGCKMCNHIVYATKTFIILLLCFCPPVVLWGFYFILFLQLLSHAAYYSMSSRLRVGSQTKIYICIFVCVCECCFFIKYSLLNCEKLVNIIRRQFNGQKKRPFKLNIVSPSFFWFLFFFFKSKCILH